jgi:hypothetical protein
LKLRLFCNLHFSKGKPIMSVMSPPLNGVTLLGPPFFQKDDQGIALSPIASVFPNYGVIVTGRGIHSCLVSQMIEYCQKKVYEQEQRHLSEQEENDIYEDAVSVMTRGQVVIIRSEPDHMDRVFRADQLLQRLLPKESIQFTGIHLESVRKQVRLRGESWRISPPPASIAEVVNFIISSRSRVATGAKYYLNLQTGTRFLTYQEFMKIRPLLREDRQEALARLREITRLLDMLNSQGYPELLFFTLSDDPLSTSFLDDVQLLLKQPLDPQDIQNAESRFDRFAEAFSDASGPELTVDEPDNFRWRTPMFCRLSSISEKAVEECVLGLSPEFHLNVRWLPGGRIEFGNLLFELSAPQRIKDLIQRFFKNRDHVIAINIGKIESSQTQRDRTGEEREVYLVVIDLAQGDEDIRLLRMIKWDVIHRLKKGLPINQAIFETNEYKQYLFDRMYAAHKLGIRIPHFEMIQLDENLPDIGQIPVYFFHRNYVQGMATDKIPQWRYRKERFIVSLARLLGCAAAASMVLGRANPRTGQIFFDDGDEVIQIGRDNLPENLILTEITGAFTDWITPLAETLPQALPRLARHLHHARAQSVPPALLSEAIDAFTDALAAEINRMKGLIDDPSCSLRTLFGSRTREHGGIRLRWEGIVHRLESADVGELMRLVADCQELNAFRAP